MKLKLNVKNTLTISVGFFSILMLWQVYNHYCPLFLQQLLEDKIENENDRLYVIGIIMALDNIFALFLLPLFAHLSDKTKTRLGKRMPYIIVGMLMSAIAFPFIAIMFVYHSLIGVIIMMGVILMIMHMFRTPMIALMPDVTPKPLRSKANGIINLVGYFGPIIAGAIISFIDIDKNPVIPFIVASAVMILSMLFLFVKINENKLLLQQEEELKLGEKLSQTLDDVTTNKLNKMDRRNLLILLLAVFLWFMSFNAIETFLSLYCKNVLNDDKIAGLGIIILTFSGVLTFLPAGILANKIGRKLSIVIGLVLIIIGFISIAFTSNFIIFYLSVSLSGVGWAIINVNSYPMACEMANQGNIGKFSGYYYLASMTAQSLTPVLVGFVMSFLTGLDILFIYSFIIMTLALIVILFFKENKTKVNQIKKGLEAFDTE